MTAGSGVPDTRTLITDEDVSVTVPVLDQVDARGWGAPWEVRARTALEAVAPRLRARWVAEALEEMAAMFPLRSHPDELIRSWAAEYRGGKR